jgi:hypothetical protein
VCAVVHIAALYGNARCEWQDGDQFPHQQRCQDRVKVVIGSRQFDQPQISTRQAWAVRMSFLVPKTLNHDLLGRREAQKSFRKRAKARLVGQQRWVLPAVTDSHLDEASAILRKGLLHPDGAVPIRADIGIRLP